MRPVQRVVIALAICAVWKPVIAACSQDTATAAFLELNAKIADMLTDGTPMSLVQELQGRVVATQSRMMAAGMRGDIQTECDEVARLQAAFRQAGIR
jgi:hypothetical protein